MGLPAMSPKRAKYSPSLDTDKFRDWSPLPRPAFSTGDRIHPFPSQFRSALDLTAPCHRETQCPPDAQSRSPIERLGEPLLLKILQMSQPTAWDLCRLSCVSREWRSTCSHGSFWTRLRVGSGSLHSGVEQLAPRCAALTELFIDDPRCELHILHPIIISCSRSLRRVVIDCDRDSSTRNEASISSLLWLLSLYCKDIESIELQSNGQEPTIGCLEGRTMWFLTSAFRKIRNFTCLAKGSLTKQCIYLMAIAWRNLECVKINMEGVRTEDLLALRKCPSLRALELVGGSLHSLAKQVTVVDSTDPSTQPPGRTDAATNPVVAEGGVGARAGAKNSGLQFRSRVATQAAELFPRQQQMQGAMLASMGGVFHPTLELLVLNRVEFDSAAAAELALACPSLRRILVSGPLCDACLGSDGACASGSRGCVRNRVDCIQDALVQ